MKRLLVSVVLVGVTALAADPARAAIESFQDGQRDRRAWEEWFNGLPHGDYKSGAIYWAEIRNKNVAKSCYRSDGKPMGDMTNGCLAAQRRLAPIDARRLAEPEYRSGFNTYIPPASTPVREASPAPVIPPQPAIVTAPAPTPQQIVINPETLQTRQNGAGLEQQFVDLIQDYASRYKTANNDMAKGAVRYSRAQAICSLMAETAATDWRGKIEKLSSNGEGKGVLSLQISNNIEIKTWNNALSDLSDQTLIIPGTTLHNNVVTMRPGQSVIFSGTFIRSKDDCFREGSMTMDGSMVDPEFVFKFTNVTLSE